MNINQLRHFMALTQTLNFRRAAAMVGIQQGPFSQSITRFEAQLGTALFERDRHHVHLTTAGEILKAEAGCILDQVEFAHQLVERSRHGGNPCLSIGYLGHGLGAVVPSIISEALRREPTMRFALRHELSGEHFVALLRGEVDVGVVYPAAGAPEGLAMRIVQRSSLVAAIPESWDLARQDSVTLRQMAEHPLILFPRVSGPELHAQFIAAFRRAGVSPTIEYGSPHAFTRLKLVAAGVGISIANQKATAKGVAGVALRPITDLPGDIGTDLAIAWHTCAPAARIEMFEAAAARFAA